MWHAARRQERAIKGMMVDYQKRAGRRKEYYDQIKQDPNQFLRVNGQSMKIHIDPSLVIAAEAPQIMQKWQGDNETLIDRYDVRSHIDYLPAVQPQKENLDIEESRCNYERYRILVQNDCVGVTEQQCLNQIEQDERFGCISTKEEDKKKKSAEKKAAIGYTYDAQNGNNTNNNNNSNKFVKPNDDEEEDEDDDELDEVDLDNILDIELLTEDQEKVLNKLSHSYQMLHDDYSQFLQIDRDEMEALRKVREIEEEKAAYSGRKSRRERKAFKDQRLKNRRIASPSYLDKGSPKKDKRARSSSSGSRSPDDIGKVEFITSFGGGDEVVVEDEVPNQENQYQGSTEVIGPQLPSRIETRSPSKRSNRGRRSRSRSKGKKFRSRSRGRRSRSRSRGRRSRRGSRGRRSRSRSKGRRRSRSRDKRSRSRETKYKSRRRSRSRRSSSSSSSSSLSYRRSSDRHRNRNVRSSKKSSSSSSSSSSNNRKHKDTSNEPITNRPPIKKYRRDSLSSSDGEFDEDDDDDDEDVTSSSYPPSRPEQWRYAKNAGESRSSKDSNKTPVLTPQERLKRKMQMTLKKQYKADKKARLEKENKEELLKQEREDELRVLSMQLRQRERERRHKQREEFDRLESEFKRSRSRSRRRSSRSRRSRSRSRRSRRSSSDSKRRSSRSRQKPKLVAY